MVQQTLSQEGNYFQSYEGQLFENDLEAGNLLVVDEEVVPMEKDLGTRTLLVH